MKIFLFQAKQPIDVQDFLGYIENTCFSTSIPEVIDAAHCLKQSGYKTAVLTNNWKKSDGSTLLPFDTAHFDVVCGLILYRDFIRFLPIMPLLKYSTIVVVFVSLEPYQCLTEAYA